MQLVSLSPTRPLPCPVHAQGRNYHCRACDDVAQWDRRNKREQRCAELRQRQLSQPKRRPTERQQAELEREDAGFRRMSQYLWRQKQALRQERYVTAFYSIPSSWSLVENYGKYYSISKITSKKVRRGTVDMPFNKNVFGKGRFLEFPKSGPIRPPLAPGLPEAA